MYDTYIRKIDHVVRVLDGDTVEICVDLGHNTFHTSNHRLEGFDAPETYRPSSPIELAAGKRVTQYLTELLEANKGKLYVKTSKDPQIYGRYTATIFSYDEEKGAPFTINAAVEKFMIENNITKEQVKACKG